MDPSAAPIMPQWISLFSNTYLIGFSLTLALAIVFLMFFKLRSRTCLDWYLAVFTTLAVFVLLMLFPFVQTSRVAPGELTIQYLDIDRPWMLILTYAFTAFLLTASTVSVEYVIVYMKPSWKDRAWMTALRAFTTLLSLSLPLIDVGNEWADESASTHCLDNVCRWFLTRKDAILCILLLLWSLTVSITLISANIEDVLKIPLVFKEWRAMRNTDNLLVNDGPSAYQLAYERQLERERLRVADIQRRRSETASRKSISEIPLPPDTPDVTLNNFGPQPRYALPGGRPARRTSSSASRTRNTSLLTDAENGQLIEVVPLIPIKADPSPSKDPIVRRTSSTTRQKQSQLADSSHELFIDPTEVVIPVQSSVSPSVSRHSSMSTTLHPSQRITRRPSAPSAPERTPSPIDICRRTSSNSRRRASEMSQPHSIPLHPLSPVQSRPNSVSPSHNPIVRRISSNSGRRVTESETEPIADVLMRVQSCLPSSIDHPRRTSMTPQDTHTQPPQRVEPSAPERTPTPVDLPPYPIGFTPIVSPPYPPGDPPYPPGNPPPPYPLDLPEVPMPQGL